MNTEKTQQTEENEVIPEKTSSAKKSGSCSRLPWVVALMLLAAGGVGAWYGHQHYTGLVLSEKQARTTAETSLLEANRLVAELQGEKQVLTEEKNALVDADNARKAAEEEVRRKAQEAADAEAARIAAAEAEQKSKAEEAARRKDSARQQLKELGIEAKDYALQVMQAVLANDTQRLQLLIEAGADVNRICKVDSFLLSTPLYQAISKGHTQCVRLLLSSPNIDPNARCNYVSGGSLPIQQAAWASPEIMQLLLQHPAISVNKTDSAAGSTALGYALTSQKKEIVKLLLTHPRLDVNRPSGSSAPLALAIRSGDDIEMLDLLLQREEIDVNNQRKSKTTALHKAARVDNLAAVKRLLEVPGINIFASNSNYKTAEQVTAEFEEEYADEGRVSRCKKVLEEARFSKLSHAPIYWKDAHYSYGNAVAVAVQAGDVETIKYLIEKGAPVNRADMESDFSPLSLAVKSGKVDCVVALLQSPSLDVNETSSLGNNPLKDAIETKQTDCLKLLLNHPRIDVNSGDDYRSPICHCMQNDNMEALKMLLNHPFAVITYKELRTAVKTKVEFLRVIFQSGCHIEATEEEMGDILYLAVGAGDLESSKLILAQPGVEVNGLPSQYPPMYYAILKNNMELLKLIIAHPGLRVNKKHSSMGTALHVAAKNGRAECIRVLLAVPGIDHMIRDDNGKTPIDLAKRAGHKECVALLQAGPTNTAPASGASQNITQNPLQAAEDGDAKALKAMIDAGVDMNVEDESGRCPLFIAVSHDFVDCVEVLLKAPSVDVNCVDGHGYPLIHYAREPKILKMLLAVPGFNVNLTPKDGTTLLWDMCALGGEVKYRDEIAQLLLNTKGIDVNKANSRGETPLQKAARGGYNNIVSMLLAHPSIDVNKGDNDLYATPLHEAAYIGNEEAVRMLLQAKGIKVDQLRKDKTSALFWAEYKNHANCARLIRAAGGRSLSPASR